jgi:hypothetical protein
MKKVFAVTAVILTLGLFLIPKSNAQLLLGHPTANMIFPGNVTINGNATVLGTLTPTGTSYTYNDLTIVYGVNMSTAVITNTGATALTVDGGITAGTGVVAIVGVDGRIPALSSLQLANLSGASLTSLTAANISAGSLGVSVIASSVAVNSVLNASIVSMAASKLTAGIMPITIQCYQVADCEALTPAAEGEFCYSTGSHIMNVSTSTNAGGFAPTTN